MRLNIFFSLLVSLLTYSSIFSQTVQWGNEAKAFKAKGNIQSLGWYDNYLYSIEVESMGSLDAGGELRLEKISKDLRRIVSVELDEAKSNLFANTHAEIQNDKLIIFNSEYKLTGKLLEIYRFEFNLDGRFIDKQKVGEIPLEKLNINKISGQFTSSPDKKKVNFLLTFIDQKDDRLTITSLTFDADSKNNVAKIEKTINLDEDVKTVSYTETVLDDLGNIYALITSKDDFNSNVTKTRFVILDKKGDYRLNQLLVFEDFFLGQVRLKINNDNHVFLNGFLSTLNDKGNALNNGFFMADIGKSSFEIEKFKSFVYSQEFFESLGYKVKKDGSVKFYGSYYLEMVLDKNKGGYLIANHRKSINSSGVGDLEIIVLQFNEELEMSDPFVVPRGLRSYPPLLNGLGYFAFINEGTLNLVYTDHEDNLEEESIEDVELVDNPKDKKAVIVLTTITAGTGIVRKSLSSENKIKGYLVPDKCQYLDGSAIINVGNRSKTLYGKIKD